METVTVSPKFQLVIPKEIRESCGIMPGQKMHVFMVGNRIELVPVRDLKELRGFLKGMMTDVPREDDRL